MYFGGSQGFSAIFKPRGYEVGKIFQPRGFEKNCSPFPGFEIVRIADEFGDGFWLREFGVVGLVFAKVWCDVLVKQV